VLKNEQEVIASVNELYAFAEKAKDRPAHKLPQGVLFSLA
jgi:ferritin